MSEKKYKQSTLERYAAAGYLDFGSRNFGAIDRLSAGKRLYADFFLGGISTVCAADMAKIRVDGSKKGGEPLSCLYHRDSYAKAVQAVPAEFWPIVRQVIIEDRPIVITGSEKQVKRELYAARLDLCRGLDRLVEFYLRMRKKTLDI